MTEDLRGEVEECSAGLPDQHFVPVTLIGPAIMAWGTEPQQRRYLPGIASGADMWCQLFSEPGAGSDLASLATRAVPGDEGWIVNGQKVWSSFASVSRYGMLLARTDPDVPKNEGITCFLVDMTAPGVTVRPLRQLTGGEHFCEVFLENLVLAPDAQLGPLNEGWRVAVSTLNAERSGLSATSGASGVELAPALALARRTGAWADESVRDRLADLIATERALRLTNMRFQARPDAKGSITKLIQSELSQRISEMQFELAGTDAAYWDTGEEPVAAHTLLDSRRLTVAGGTSEIQRNIIGERVLGLDREPDPDRGRPWRELRRG
ncbi:acyl-CoA dehydrogenase family protein [Mycolicibacterium sp. XJ870]